VRDLDSEEDEFDKLIGKIEGSRVEERNQKESDVEMDDEYF
jgi:hypothetical protein